MSKILIFLFISTGILLLTAIAISLAPIINDVANLKTDSAKDLDCSIFSNQEELSKTNIELNRKLKNFQNLCIRQKAMYNLEYISLIINAILAFLCTNFALLNYFKEGEAHQKKTGMFGLISGIIAFILTFIYVCFSGYIFTNDVAYGNININYLSTTGPSLSGTINKLFSNGARYKYNGNRYITSYEKSTEYNGQFVKYKDLGNKEYNYDKDRYIKYQENKPNNTDQLNGCNIYSDYSLNGNSKINNCDYLFPEPYSSNFNKYLYDRWLTTLILAVFIFILDIILAIFGFLLFINKEEQQKEYGNDLIVYGNK